ncbi:MAG: hypothetical protein M1817_001223 [Caeruleum heppii]|nr:MAG: hypothetical protein M1817_001223 [Caeruleum heppii]
MSSKDRITNVTVVGASGLVGGEIVKSLLDSGSFNVTALSRQDSTANFAPGVSVKKGDYKSPGFLESALRGQDVLIITLAVTTAPDVQSDLIKAAANAGVPWVLPNEWGQDGANPELAAAVPLLGHKAKYRKEIEELGRSSWIGVANNLWFDFSLKGGFYGIDIPARKARVCDGGTNAFAATTVAQVGRAIARLLSLPVQASSPSSPSLSDYKNKFIYISSFSVSQNDMLAAVQRATGTTPSEWTVTDIPVDEFIQDGRDKFAKGDRMGMINVLYGATFKRGLGDQYHGRELANEKLGLKEEDLDEVVQRVVKEVEGK